VRRAPTVADAPFRDGSRPCVAVLAVITVVTFAAIA
jgi:hypothetical protein